MQVLINDPVQQTILFGVVFCVIFLLTFYTKKNYSPFSLTQELKGFAILAVIFAHIGYTLSSSSEFLFPFSVLAGVGVNLFLFLSGYGLTYSLLRKEGSILGFYTKRLPKLIIPFWIVLGVLFVLDYVVLGQMYAKEYIVQSFSGVFMGADMFTDINSPLWYFSLILFYYVLFPLVFFKRYTWITALFLYCAVWSIVEIDAPALSGVIGLYQVHLFAFPLGIVTARYLSVARALLSPLTKIYTHYTKYLYLPLIALLTGFIWYFSIHANVGALAYIEEVTSLSVMVAVILLFILKKRESKMLSIFGLYSYEIYLLHWPIMFRYDFLYIHLPAWLAVLLYLGVFLLLAFALNKFFNFLVRSLKPTKVY